MNIRSGKQMHPTLYMKLSKELMIKGLAKRFDTSIEIELLDGSAPGHQKFRLREGASES